MDIVKQNGKIYAREVYEHYGVKDIRLIYLEEEKKEEKQKKVKKK